MSIEVRIITDSINTTGDRITTYILRYPRFIHSELMTHRVFSRNAASSRAIPCSKMIASVISDPAMPVWWGREQKGMQSGDEIEGEYLEKIKKKWLEIRDVVAQGADELRKLGLHKSLINRIIEPWAHMNTLVTSTEYNNFFNLRAHKDAQPEFKELAIKMIEAYHLSKPTLREESPGLVSGWHLPFADKFIDESLTLKDLLKIVTARAARISYLTMENNIDPEKDYALHDTLSANGHWSPFEHAAYASPGKRSGNFSGWTQYRKQFINENRTTLEVDIK